ncbi:MAG: glycosyltransferase family 4 protein [Candidatus Omnitrophica bacterium]|nr:glycosyltransferase family 4 protein [Candidatus Omnitrophota bacterium]
MNIKVLHIITRLDAGGSAFNTMETVARLDPRRYESWLVAGKTEDKKGRIAQMLAEKRVRSVFINELRREINPFNDFIALGKLFCLIRKERFDIVHTHTSKAGILGRWAAWLAGTPLIVHTPHGHVFYGYFGKLITGFFICLERVTAQITDQMIALTNLEREEHLQFKIAPRRKFVTIPSGIDFTALQKINSRLRKDFQIPEDSLIFGTVARLEPIKGVEFLIKAMGIVAKKYPYARLLIVGDGAERLKLETLCQALGISAQVNFAGFLWDPVAAIRMMDVFILPSLNEGMGRVIIEAMACGKPVIGTRAGGIPDLIQDNMTGLLVPPRDGEKLAQAMMHFAKDPALIKLWGEQAKKSVTQEFSVEYMVEQIDSLYQNLLKEHT